MRYNLYIITFYTFYKINHPAHTHIFAFAGSLHVYACYLVTQRYC